MFDFFFNHSIFEPLLPFGGGQGFLPYHPPIVSYTSPTATHPQGGIEHTTGAFCSPKLITSRWQESKRGTDRWQGICKRRANSTNESAPSPPPGVGAFGTSVPDPLRLPTRTSSHPRGTSVDGSHEPAAERSTVAQRGIQTAPARMAAAEAAGKPDQEDEDQTSLFFCSRFFS